MALLRFRQLLNVVVCVTLLTLLYLFHETYLVRIGKVPGVRDDSTPYQHVPSNDTIMSRVRQQLDQHPITTLIAQAQERKRQLLSLRSHDVKSAARRYRDRRSRHPPPGFDAWFAYAQETNAVIIESFFDRIYDDLRPFWSVAAAELRRQTHPRQWDLVLGVRQGRAYQKNEGVDPMSRMRFWMSLVEELEVHLPDLDIPINGMDESRVLVPWEEINRMTYKAISATRLVPTSKVVPNYSGLPALDAAVESEDPLIDWKWITEDSNRIWNIMQTGCPPESPGANTIAIHVVDDPPMMPTEWPMHSYQGFISNWTSASDPCQHPHLRSLHGAFIEPVSIRTTPLLAPLFGGSKLPMNNEILIPAAMYLSPDELYAGGGETGPAWTEKKDGIVWRGVASGGRSKFDTWTHFHRHRFLQMVNSTAVAQAEGRDLKLGVNLTFRIPDEKAYPLMTTFDRPQDYLSSWLEQVDINVAFNHLWCFPGQPDPFGHKCSYTDNFFATAPVIPMAEQYKYKFLPDIDGNSFSGRFRAFLQSTSLPIKASIYAEWHDSRLIPWVHFAPMDNSYVDLYGILDYFLADELVSSNSEDGMTAKGKGKSRGETIAIEGKDWAEQVLRREDMKLYTWRLLLEWARVCDDQRDYLGFVQDLTEP